MKLLEIPELLAPAGSLDAARAAIANGANAIYLGAEKFNARDDGAQLTLDDVETACALAHERGVRVYLTFNVLVKAAELAEALEFLGEAIDRGIDAAIVQDIGIVRLIQDVYPGFEIHGSTQMTVHDASGAAVMKELGIERVVLARENTLDDIRAIRDTVPGIGLETFVHGALCISYSGQCFMSGMISERSANRGSCAQSCRKDYVLTDVESGDTLDTGYLISAKDLGAYDSLAEIAKAGVGCLKVEGRKKKPEYVATITQGYRKFLDRIEEGDIAPPSLEEVQPLVQIFSRGFTPGMYTGRAGREYITRDQPDNRGLVLGVVTAQQGRKIIVEVSTPLVMGDGIAIEPLTDQQDRTVGGTISTIRTLRTRAGLTQQAVVLRVAPRSPVQVGWRIVRTSDITLLEQSRASYADVDTTRKRKSRVDVSVFGTAGAPLKVIWTVGEHNVTVRSDISLAIASRRSLDVIQLREQFGRLGDSQFALGSVTANGLSDGLFIPVSELNRLRQEATEQLTQLFGWDDAAKLHARTERIANKLARLQSTQESVTFQQLSAPMPAQSAAAQPAQPSQASAYQLCAHVFDLADAQTAADAGATEIVLDPFIRHPAPPLSKVRALAESLRAANVSLRLRTPTIVRPEDRKQLDKWLALDLPILTGHLGLISELAKSGKDIVADYAVNCFNPYTANELFRIGAKRIVASIELTTDEIAQVVAPWNGVGFDIFLYGRPEGMTIEHCVLSAAFDRVPTTCRDLCVQKHKNVALTDPTGYTFAVATDSDCRNRLLHSRPVEGSEFLPKLWSQGIRNFHAVFNVVGDDIATIISGYKHNLDSLSHGIVPQTSRVRDLVGQTFTRGHFSRAV